MHVTVIVAAAGEGERIGGAIPKPYLLLAGRPVILRTLDQCFAAETVNDVILVVAESELGRCEALLHSDGLLRDRSWRLQTGGASRQESVKRGLEKIGSDTDIVVIHDGARPLVSSKLIDQCIETTCDKGAVVVGVPVRDTIKVISDDRFIQSTPDRSRLWEIQTPQVFRRNLIIEAHDSAAQARIETTDDAMLVERIGKPVFVVQGDRSNLKITVPEDILFAEALIQNS
jgi:2-C-methyl-D-erythritol 4-phosphate cytidylyltransferase